MEEIDPRFTEFKRLFNEEKFFEAHEALELLWLDAKKARHDLPPENPVDFYHGLIQIAAAFVHLKKGSPEGARKLLESASRYLAPYPPLSAGIFIQKLLLASKKCLYESTPFPKIGSD